jgi:hypothetical protein
MTTGVAPAVPLERLAVPASAVVAVVARLPFLHRALGPDEAGYLLVGQQWRPGGTSLYGSYWVDRPPLLVTLFGIAADLGGAVPLRLTGCLATAIVVLGCARVARTIAGHRAAAWAAALAAGLCVSPRMGGLEVNGELLAAPFVVTGIAAVLAAVHERRESRTALAAGLAGAAMIAALFVKQNMADVGVFAVVVLLVGWRTGDVPGRRLRTVAISYAVGAALAVAVTAAWTLWHGTSLSGVYDAMYPFRIEAGRLMASPGHHQHATARMWTLVVAWLVSGGGVVMAAVAWALATRRLVGAVVWGLVATVGYDVVSVALGGNYWHHYLIELVVPIAVLAGVLVCRRLPAMRTILVASFALAAYSWSGTFTSPGTSVASTDGLAIRAVARTGDTIVTALGHADVTQAAGLRSPYPYLWSLPALTLDPRLTKLDQVLGGPHAPTWFVGVSNIRGLGTPGATAERLLHARYHRIADLHGEMVYLRKGVHRAVPDVPGSDPADVAARATTAAASQGGHLTSARRAGRPAPRARPSGPATIVSR